MTPSEESLLSGKSAMLIDYQHIWYEGRDPSLSVLGEDGVEVAIVPGYGGDLPVSGSQTVGECFGIAKTSPYQEAALGSDQALLECRHTARSAEMRSEMHVADPADESGFPSYIEPYSDHRFPTRCADRRHHLQAAGVQGGSVRRTRRIPDDLGCR